MFQNGFGVTKYVVIASLCVRWNNAIIHGSLASSFWLIGLSGFRIRIKSQGLGIRTEAQRVKGSGSRIIIVEGQDLGSLLSKAICSISRNTYKALQQHLL